jgi:hypothetical protein
VTVGATDSGSGVKALTLTLSGVSHAPYMATPGSANTYVFSVPAADLNVADNTRGSVNFRIEATDNVGNGASSSGQPWQVLSVDRVKPSVSPVADSSWYSRTGGILTVSATITKDPLGSPLVTTGTTRPLMMVGASGPFFGTNTSGTTWQFPLDPTLAPAGAEAPLNFTINAVDAAGNIASQAGFRNVDDAAPVVTNLLITKSGAGTTGTGVQYPAALANTGYNGSRFIYHDSIHIQGTIQDQGAGIAVVSGTPTPALRLDGIAVGGVKGSAAGPALAITTCTDGQTSPCTFTMDIVSNDLTKAGPFNAADNALQLAFSLQDKALNAGGTSQPNIASMPAQDIQVTRLWWSLPTGTTVSGLAIHPDGDVIATGGTAVSSNTLFALYHDGPFNAGAGVGMDWQKGKDWFAAASDLGSIDGAPSIGAGGQSSARIYVATRNMHAVGISPSGVQIWQCPSLGIFHQPPAIAGVSNLNGTACEAAFMGGDDSFLYGACGDPLNSNVCVQRPGSMVGVATSAVTISGGAFYLGANTQVTKATLNANFTIVSTFPSGGATNAINNIVFGASKFFAIAPAVGTSNVYEFTSALGTDWTTNPAPVTNSINGQAVLEPADSGLVLAAADMKLHSLAVATGTNTDLKTLTTEVPYGPLLGSDGRIYIGTNLGSVKAVNDSVGYTVSWSANIATIPIATALTMACDGTLYAAGGNTVYALITDAQGLRNSSPWPKYQRDTRNSGNADAATMWGVRTAPGAAGCVP